MKGLKKWIFRILKVLGVFVALYLIIGLFAPSDYKVERSREMIASQEAIYSLISSFESWDSWSPWVEKDSTLVNTLSGEDGLVGTKQSWKGDPDISGEGSITFTEMIPNEKVTYELFFGDMNMTSNGSISITPVEGKFKVVWENHGDIPFLWRTMSLFMDMDKMMGPDLERGLEKIDSLALMRQVELETPFEITEVDFPETFYYGIKQNLDISDVDSTVFSSVYGQLGAFSATNQIDMTGAPVCITFEWNEPDGTCVLMPAFQVASNSKAGSDNIISYTIPASRAVVVDYYGSYDDLGKGHEAANKYMISHNLRGDLSVEEYVTDPTTVDSEDQILTRIYYILE